MELSLSDIVQANLNQSVGVRTTHHLSYHGQNDQTDGRHQFVCETRRQLISSSLFFGSSSEKKDLSLKRLVGGFLTLDTKLESASRHRPMLAGRIQVLRFWIPEFGFPNGILTSRLPLPQGRDS
jgi:hypothetical protein